MKCSGYPAIPVPSLQPDLRAFQQHDQRRVAMTMSPTFSGRIDQLFDLLFGQWIDRRYFRMVWQFCLSPYNHALKGLFMLLIVEKSLPSPAGAYA